MKIDYTEFINSAYPIFFIDGDKEIHFNAGISKRDYFAAKAMQGMLANGISLDIDGEQIAIGRAKTAYVIADAMLKACEL